MAQYAYDSGEMDAAAVDDGSDDDDDVMLPLEEGAPVEAQIGVSVRPSYPQTSGNPPLAL